MSYRDMIWIACMVASADIDRYGKETVRDMIETSSSNTVIDFFDAYQKTFGIDMSEQLDFVLEIIRGDDE
tara:strand:+ start:4056 stop:4265 length:210 start_codon:yes stop_codon:yes gene_type:complete